MNSKKTLMILFVMISSLTFGCSSKKNNVVPVKDYDSMIIKGWSNYTDIGVGVRQQTINRDLYTIEELNLNDNHDVLPYLIGVLPNGDTEKIVFEPEVQQTMYLTGICSLTKYTFVEFSNHPEVGNYYSSGSWKFENSNIDSIVRMSYVIDHQTGKLYLIPELTRFIINGWNGNDSLQAGDYVYVRATKEEIYSKEEIYRIGLIEGELEVNKIDYGSYDYEASGSYFVDKYNNLFISIRNEDTMYLVPSNGEITIIEKYCYRWINGLAYTSDGRHYNELGILVESSFIPVTDNINFLTTDNKILNKGNVDYYYHHNLIDKFTWINEENYTREQIVLESFYYENAVLGERIYYVSSCGCDLYWVDILTGSKTTVISRYAVYDLVSTGKAVLFSGDYKNEPIEGFLNEDGQPSNSVGPLGIQLVYVWAIKK